MGNVKNLDEAQQNYAELAAVKRRATNRTRAARTKCKVAPARIEDVHKITMKWHKELRSQALNRKAVMG
eukprot:CAMPEP_0194064458 /NCGR_PEP_ID=MMETSP0009_2-20130614/83087_1 /TAXON_ID=210454 /ORGANISM="Grammatophora oceanica, Strain CCMP 410" /LENGTH=68 /DNA_ID=CAMNT_0038716937 /DNA_START=44 /DNA_END=246 /DNA_ORIENTATION=-